MKLNVSNLLTVFVTLFILSLSAQAQDELPIYEPLDANHREFNLNEDKTLIYDRPTHTSGVRDSIQVAPRIAPVQTGKTSKPDSGKNNAKEGNDDALSFNFLYYMLQKFKLSDLIDQ